MKTFIILLSLIAVVIADENGKGEFKKMFKECMEKEGATDVTKEKEDIFKQMNSDNPAQPIKCVQACLLEKMHIMLPPDNKFDLEAANKIYMKKLNADEEKAKKLQDIFKECSEQVKSNERCQRGHEFWKCKSMKFHELGIKMYKHKHGNHDKNSE